MRKIVGAYRPRPKEGDTRMVERFVLWNVLLTEDGLYWERRWLERCCILQRYSIWGGWEDERWA